MNNAPAFKLISYNLRGGFPTDLTSCFAYYASRPIGLALAAFSAGSEYISQEKF